MSNEVLSVTCAVDAHQQPGHFSVPMAALEERLIKMVDIERIRYAHFREGSSICELALALHHSRTTIRRALDDPGPWMYRWTRRRPPAAAHGRLGGYDHLAQPWSYTFAMGYLRFQHN